MSILVGHDPPVIDRFGRHSKIIQKSCRRSEGSMPKGQTFDKGFKQDAVRLVQAGGKSMSQFANDLGVSVSTLSRWCQDAAINQEHAFVGSGHQQPEAEELRRLRHPKLIFYVRHAVPFLSTSSHFTIECGSILLWAILAPFSLN